MKNNIEEKIKELSRKHDLRYEKKEERHVFSINFLPNGDLMWHEAKLIVWYKETPEGKYNWWKDNTFDDKHQISGPGYPAYTLCPQTPIDSERILNMIDKNLATLEEYRRYAKKWY
ncbi:MAG: hypothetical protein IJ504_00895 [Bacteroidales bacterium]|nr:hypothetical protein [Bacteroidales bacterium]